MKELDIVFEPMKVVFDRNFVDELFNKNGDSLYLVKIKWERSDSADVKEDIKLLRLHKNNSGNCMVMLDCHFGFDYYPTRVTTNYVLGIIKLNY